MNLINSLILRFVFRYRYFLRFYKFFNTKYESLNNFLEFIKNRNTFICKIDFDEICARIHKKHLKNIINKNEIKTVFNFNKTVSSGKIQIYIERIKEELSKPDEPSLILKDLRTIVIAIFVFIICRIILIFLKTYFNIQL